jgi:hypothetical protein
VLSSPCREDHALYLVSYDIQERNHDEYQELWDCLENLGGVKILYSEYVVPFDTTALDLANAVNKHLLPKDRLLVCELFNGGTGAWTSLLVKTRFS